MVFEGQPCVLGQVKGIGGRVQGAVQILKEKFESLSAFQSIEDFECCH